MPGPSLIVPTLYRGTIGTTQGAIRPVRVGWRPFTERTRGKRQVLLDYARGSSNATPNYGNVGVFGIELPYDTAQFGVNPSGQLVGGFNPFTSGPGSYLQTGTIVEKIKVSGGAAAGISLITVLDGGADVTSAPTVVFTGGGGSSAAATAIVRDRRVVGVVITNAGSGYTSAPAITFTGGGTPTRQPVAICGVGQQVTINTHIPYAAHAPLASGGAFWFATVEGPGGSRILMCNTSAVAAFNNADDGALDPDQHIMGISSNAGFTIATGTHPDGTLTIGVLTLAAGLPNGTIVNVYQGTVRELSALGQHLSDVTQIRALDLMWFVGGAASDNSINNVSVAPASYL